MRLLLLLLLWRLLVETGKASSLLLLRNNRLLRRRLLVEVGKASCLWLLGRLDLLLWRRWWLLLLLLLIEVGKPSRLLLLLRRWLLLLIKAGKPLVRLLLLRWWLLLRERIVRSEIGKILLRLRLRLLLRRCRLLGKGIRGGLVLAAAAAVKVGKVVGCCCCCCYGSRCIKGPKQICWGSRRCRWDVCHRGLGLPVVSATAMNTAMNTAATTTTTTGLRHRRRRIPALVPVLALDPVPEMFLVLGSDRLSVVSTPLLGGIVLGQPNRVVLFVRRLADHFHLFFAKGRVAQALDFRVDLPVEARARHANKGPASLRHVDALGHLGSAIGAFFVGEVFLGNPADLVRRALNGLAAVARVAGAGACAAASGA